MTLPAAPLRLVLDTNVWLDWLVFFDPAVVRLRAAVERGEAEVLMDEACCDELRRVRGATGGNRRAPRAADEPAAAVARARAIARPVPVQADEVGRAPPALP